MKNTIHMRALFFSLSLFFCSIASFAQDATVVIGKQTWSVANLNLDHFSDGTPITQAKDISEWKMYAESGTPAWCYYNFDAKLGKINGKIYNIHAVLSARGLAPVGFHVPDNDDWTILQNYLGGAGSMAIKMKSTSGWMNEANGKNETKFNALPSGYLNDDDTFSGLTFVGAWWTSNEYAANIIESGKTKLYSFGLYPVNSSNKHFGFPVRYVNN